MGRDCGGIGKTIKTEWSFDGRRRIVPPQARGTPGGDVAAPKAGKADRRDAAAKNAAAENAQPDEILCGGGHGLYRGRFFECLHDTKAASAKSRTGCAFACPAGRGFPGTGRILCRVRSGTGHTGRDRYGGQ